MPNAKLYQLIMVIVVAACTTQPNKVATAAPDLQCHSEQTTGTLVAKTVCTTRAQRVDEQGQLDELKGAVEAGVPVRHN